LRLDRPVVAERRERALVRDAQGGSAEAFEQLFRSHWPRAYRAALLVVGDAAAAEDIAQESFLAAVRALDRFDRRRPFGPWLHRIVVNRAIDWSRARTLRRELSADAVAEPAAAAAEPEPVPARPPLRWGLAAAALLCAVAASAFSPPGRAVVDAVRRTIGVEHAAPALFRLPASGRLLVSGSGGTWLVAADGAK